jgi:hypothetical protein
MIVDHSNTEITILHPVWGIAIRPCFSGLYYLMCVETLQWAHASFKESYQIFKELIILELIMNRIRPEGLICDR